jgi:hypothetical protein
MHVVQYCGYSVGEAPFYFGLFVLTALGKAKT